MKKDHRQVMTLESAERLVDAFTIATEAYNSAVEQRSFSRAPGRRLKLLHEQWQQARNSLLHALIHNEQP
jgi:hypothetical protein